MREHAKIEAALLDPDGANVNFHGPTWDGVQALLQSLEDSFGTISGTDQEGRVIVRPLAASVLAVARDYWFVQDAADPNPGKLTSGSAHLVLGDGRGLFKRLQLFVASEDDGSPFVEVTCFPEGLLPTIDLRLDFIRWADRVCRQLQARRYYARDANASWKFGDTGPNSGVFWVSDEFRGNEAPGR